MTYNVGDNRYAEYGAKLVNTYFLDSVTGMYPTLEYAQNGYKYGLIDWKDMYYFLDALTLLEKSKALNRTQVKQMRKWCKALGVWYLTSKMGFAEVIALNNHGLYFDVTVFSLFLYAKEDNYVDSARARILYRLAKESPLGHFALDGSQPHESSRPTGI